MIIESDINWKFHASLNMSKYHHTVMRDDKLGLQKESITNKTHGGYGLGRCNVSFYIDGDDREFLSESGMVDAYNDKFKFEDENPEHQVRFVKVITKRTTPPRINV